MPPSISVAAGVEMRLWLLIVACAVTLLSCSDDKREEERKREVQERSAYLARIQEGTEAERQLMSDISSAGPALERRLDEWIRKREGIIFAVEPRMVYILPGKTTWMIRCDKTGIGITLGSWVAQDEGSSSSVIEKDLTKAKLSEEQCLILGAILGQKLTSITRE